MTFEESAWFNPIAYISNFVHNVSEGGLWQGFAGSEKYPSANPAAKLFGVSPIQNGASEIPQSWLEDADRIIESMEIAEDKANALNIANAREAMQFEHDETRAYWKWLEDMSNSEVTRMINQLRENGLNPALAYTNPASTPSGSAAHGFAASASSQQRPSENLGLAKSKVVASVLEAAIGAITSIATKGVVSFSGKSRKIGF